MEDRSCTVGSPLGELLLLASPKGLAEVFLPSSKGVPATTDVPHDPAAHCLPEARTQLQAYFAGTLQAFDLPLDLTGSPFQLAVWQALTTIPFAETRSYGEIAALVGADPAVASRAVGLANGANPLAIVVPCHRVVGANGDLVGYAGGLHAKRWLLDHEARTAGVVLF
ncbi:MAG TPA: methylated-DNA--[protein]-cysteine S-methyltransferase [Mycobacteriales bacterium]|nr:methylated-DNA--[protein]-cysteine S-methyltransferase [Mycobacteriales bacterium]